ncbi:MAG: C45 family autoproteolytic acyltransferase/hydrolase [Acidobacteriota bacterium]
MRPKRSLIALVAFLAVAAGVLSLGRGHWPIDTAPGLSWAQADDTDVRLTGAFREERGGWTFVHIQGEPGVRGYQYGYLMAPEIDQFIRFMKVYLEKNTGKNWSYFRDETKRLFGSKIEIEYRQEIAGIAKGLQARGMAEDALDVMTTNAFFELLGALEESERRQGLAPSMFSRLRHMRCSAFVATGEWTNDGKVVMAHNSWDDYVLGQHWNVVLDVKPSRGQRILLETAPGLIHSGTDFAINSAGICITETTIGFFSGFDENGLPEFMRARKAAQYSRSLYDFVRIMSRGNNGGYANTWLIADIKTNEIGKLELGLLNVTFSRSRTGYYDGENYVDDSKMIREECGPTLWGTLGNWPDDLDGANCVTARRLRWHALMAEHKGRIDADLAKAFLADQFEQKIGRVNPGGMVLMARMEITDVPEIPGAPAPRPFGANDGKVVTAELAKKMSFWVRLGHPDGSAFAFGPFLQQHPEFAWQAPYLKDLVDRPWSLFRSKDAPGS